MLSKVGISAKTKLQETSWTFKRTYFKFDVEITEQIAH